VKTLKVFLMGVVVGAVFHTPIRSTVVGSLASVVEEVRAEAGRAEPWRPLQEPALELTPTRPMDPPPINSSLGTEGRLLPSP
jgi:hypothetical protein